MDDKKTKKSIKIRRALLSVSDKTGVIELAKALILSGAEVVATGRTANVLKEAGLKITPIEELSGSPESFQGRMKTLSFPVCSGILYRRGNRQDEHDLEKLNVKPIDCVVVNFYPFESAVFRHGISTDELIEEIDIGGPTLVRAAAKNATHVLVLTSPHQYAAVIQELKESSSASHNLLQKCASEAWDLIKHYDAVIAGQFGSQTKKVLRYGENPHQKGYLEYCSNSPIAWDVNLTSSELSYNNILDLSAAYSLASELVQEFPDFTGAVIIKHNNPCGVSWVPKSLPNAQKLALIRAWEGDPVSAFGSVILFTDPLEEETAEWLGQHFIELISAPLLSVDDPSLEILLKKRKKIKAVLIRALGASPRESHVAVPGGVLIQEVDENTKEVFKCVTEKTWPEEKTGLGKFGVLVCKSLKSNAIALVREARPGTSIYQLVGAGQGQPNRVDALQNLALPRAQNVLRASEGSLSDCILISDAFFPFRDTVDLAHSAGIRFIVQPGGSMKDAESIEACNEHGIVMVFTGVRHFRH